MYFPLALAPLDVSSAHLTLSGSLHPFLSLARESGEQAHYLALPSVGEERDERDDKREKKGKESLGNVISVCSLHTTFNSSPKEAEENQGSENMSVC